MNMESIRISDGRKDIISIQINLYAYANKRYVQVPWLGFSEVEESYCFFNFSSVYVSKSDFSSNFSFESSHVTEFLL